MKKKHKNKLITISISLFLFLLVGFLIYVIYVYAYYDKHMESVYLDNFNKNKYDFVYDHMAFNTNRYSFDKTVNILFDENFLKDIYIRYYANTYDKDEFVKKYSFSSVKVADKDIRYIESGKTSLFTRKELKYDEITLVNSEELVTKLGVFNNIRFVVLDGSKVKIDDDLTDCEKDICSLEAMYGGIHLVKYYTKDKTYAAIVNIYSDDQVIYLDNIDTLVEIRE